MLPKDAPEKALLSFAGRLGKPCSPGQGAQHRAGAEQSIAPTESSHGSGLHPSGHGRSSRAVQRWRDAERLRNTV